MTALAEYQASRKKKKKSKQTRTKKERKEKKQNKTKNATIQGTYDIPHVDNSYSPNIKDKPLL